MALPAAGYGHTTSCGSVRISRSDLHSLSVVGRDTFVATACDSEHDLHITSPTLEASANADNAYVVSVVCSTFNQPPHPRHLFFIGVSEHQLGDEGGRLLGVG